MLKQYDVEIEQILLHYDPTELERWRQGDPALVPERVLQWEGPGMANGYGYGEFFVKRYLESIGHEVIANEFDIYSGRSKYKDNNLRIEAAMGSSAYNVLKNVLHKMSDDGIKLEQPDLCIISPQMFFGEVKRDKDELRDPQALFAVIIWELMGIPFKVYKLLPQGQEWKPAPIYRSDIIPSRYFD